MLTVKIGPETAVKFIAFEKLKELICKDPNNVTTVERLVAGSGKFARCIVMGALKCSARARSCGCHCAS